MPEATSHSQAAAPTKLKVCGVTNLADARHAIESGAQLIGLIFVRESPRSVYPEKAMEVVSALSGKAQFVGVFKNTGAEIINLMAKELKLDLIQCHGQESAEELTVIELPVIKAVEISMTDSVQSVHEKAIKYKGAVKYLLFDRPKQEKSAGWLDHAIAILTALKDELPQYFFAGGLNGDNVGPVVSRLEPFGIDVASSIEISPGLKDHAKVEQFAGAVGVRPNPDRSERNLSVTASEESAR